MAREWLDYRTKRGRAAVLLADLAIVGAGVVIATQPGRRWSWGPFVLGPIVGLLGLGAYAALLRVAIKIFRPDPAQVSEARQRLRQRNPIIVAGYVCIGLFAGLVAGSLRSYRPDVVLGLMILVFAVLVPLAVLPLAKRKADALRARDG
jgi:hypothetical protein